MNDNINFYRMQYEMLLKDVGNFSLYMDNSSSRIDDLLDLVKDKPVDALELGSGWGLDAVNMSLKGIKVDAVEIVSELNTHARELQAKYNSNVKFVEADFLNYEPKKLYDLIYYMDGFGVSTYENQVLLLNLISQWMKPEGNCVIEVYNPIYWKKVDGRKMQLSDKVNRIYSFDYDRDSFVDTWINTEDNSSYTQVLQCYSLEDMKKMIELTGLRIDSVHSGGAMDFEKNEYIPKVSLEECLNYKLVLRVK